MKRSWPCLVALTLLSSCIPVDDFGTYWDKGVADPALEGTWIRAGRGPNTAGAPGANAWTFTKIGASYVARAMGPAAPGRVDSRQFNARSLRIGGSQFLMLRDPDGRTPGLIGRYDVQGTTLREYRIESATALDFLKTKHPTVKSIRKNAEGSDVSIVTVDDEAMRVLTEMADDPAFWRLDGEYTKLAKGGEPTVSAPGNLAAPPGSSLPPADRPQLQAVTLTEVSQQRDVDSQFFIAGVGYVAINGGGTVLAGMNRALDPFVELTIANRQDPILTACRGLLTPASLTGHAIRISGNGRFSRRAGVNDRYLVVVRLETLTECTQVERR